MQKSAGLTMDMNYEIYITELYYIGMYGVLYNLFHAVSS